MDDKQIKKNEAYKKTINDANFCKEKGCLCKALIKGYCIWHKKKEPSLQIEQMEKKCKK